MGILHPRAVRGLAAVEATLPPPARSPVPVSPCQHAGARAPVNVRQGARVRVPVSAVPRPAAIGGLPPGERLAAETD